MKEILEYLNELKKLLDSFGLKNNDKIIENIKKQMISLIKLWNNKEVRNGIMFFSKEEAKFYLPKCNIDISSFVVCTIRNSLIETAHSDFYKENNFEVELSGEQIKKITSQAIGYFKNISLEKICSELNDDNNDNYYLNIINSYPLAWYIILQIANTKKHETHFDKITCEAKKVYLPLIRNQIENKRYTVIEDGFDVSFNTFLCESLENVVNSEQKVFFTDSFKFISRNFEKNIKILQYLLERNCSYVNFNYYISNGYLAIRNNLLKPSHDTKEMRYKFKNNNDLTSKHKNALKNINILFSL